jgi:hypothetical protein
MQRRQLICSAYRSRFVLRCCRNAPLWAKISLAAIVLFALPSTTLSDTPYWDFLFQDKLRESHILDEERLFPPPDGTPEQVEQLVRRRARLRYQRVTDLMKKYGIKINDVEKQLDLLKNNPALLQSLGQLAPSSPLLPAEVRKIIEDAKLNPSKLEQYKEFLGKAQQELAIELPAAKPPDQPEAESAPSTTGDSASESASSSSSGPIQAAGTSLGQQASVPLAERIMEWIGPSLRNSPAVRRALSDLGRHANTIDPRWDRLMQGTTALSNRWRNWDGSQLGTYLPESASSLLRGLNVSLPGIQLPETNSGSGGSSGGAADSVSGGASGILSWQAWTVLGVLGVFAALIWLVGDRASRALGKADADHWRLGPWPVNPASVKSRQDVVRAFEYLSLLSLGLAARSWNHCAIAERLALLGAMPAQKDEGERMKDDNEIEGHERRRTVLELATLYEKARYAPPSESLPEAALAVARRDLCFLAGVPTA